MFGLYDHPATQFVCRHCHKNAGYDPEHCFYCGPICGECLNKPCPREPKQTQPEPTTTKPAKKAKPSRKR